MANIQLPPGKFVPPIQSNPDITRVINNIPSAPQSGNISFSDELNLKMQQVNAPSNRTYYKPAAQPTLPPPQVIPIPETLPRQAATPAQMESSIVNNLQKYQAMNAYRAGQPTAQSVSTASLPTMNTAMRNAQVAVQPMHTQTTVYDSQPVQPTKPTHTMNSVFSRSLSQPEPISTAPIQSAQSVNVPAPEVQLTAEEVAQLDALIAGQGVTQLQHPQQTNKLIASQSQQELAQQPSDSSKKKGFFGSLGSFFKNVASGLTLGMYRPDNEPSPQGIARVTEPFKKLLWDAPKSLFIDTPVGAYRDIRNLGSDESKQTTIAMNNNAQRIIAAGEKAISERRSRPAAAMKMMGNRIS